MSIPSRDEVISLLIESVASSGGPCHNRRRCAPSLASVHDQTTARLRARLRMGLAVIIHTPASTPFVCAKGFNLM